MKLQKLGGYSSLMFVLLEVLFVLMIIVYPGLPGTLQITDLSDPAKLLAAQTASPIVFRNLFFGIHLYVILVSIFVLLLALSLQERMKAGAPNLMRISVIAVTICSGLMIASAILGNVAHTAMASAQDASAYRALLVTIDGLNSARIHALGWGVLLIGWAGVRTRALPRILGCILLVCGILMIFKFITSRFSTVSDLLNTIGFLWLGIFLLRKPNI